MVVYSVTVSVSGLVNDINGNYESQFPSFGNAVTILIIGSF